LTARAVGLARLPLKASGDRTTNSGSVRAMDGADVRKVLLELIRGMSASNGGSFGRYEVLKQAAIRLACPYDPSLQKLVLDGWDDLYRSGIISWGLDVGSDPNAGSSWAHLTAHGTETLKNLSRDPSNPHGYRAAIDDYVRDLPVVVSYLAEALDTFNKGSIKASAVMLGAAAESMNLGVRDKLKERMLAGGKSPPKALDDFRIATVLRTMEAELKPRVKDMSQGLGERFESYWSAWTGLFRMTRNEAGHPKSVDPVSWDAVHSALVLFHEQSRLAHDLRDWIGKSF
jgi:hypothetical protein